MMVTSLNDVVATVATLRTLLVVLMVPPVLVVVLPFVAGGLLVALNFVTRGYGYSTLLGTLLLVYAGTAFISAYSPTKKHRNDALNQSKAILPFLSFVVSILLLQFVLLPIATVLGLKHWLTMTPTIPYNIIFQTSIALLLLGFSVILRYLGPCTVMRASCFPTVTSPLTTTWNTYWNSCTSVDGLLELFASDTPGVLIQAPLPTTGRRNHGPRMSNSVCLLVISGVLAFVAGIAMSWSDVTMSHLMTRVSCVTVVFHLLCTCLDGKSHEINPVQYQSSPLQISWKQFKTYFDNFALASCLIPISAAYFWYYSSHDVIEGSLINKGTLIAYAVGLSVAAVAYLSFIDLACRISLCSSGANVYHNVVELTADATFDTTMTVLVRSILLDDETSVKAVLKPTSTLISNRQEEEELARLKNLCEKMSEVVVTKPCSDFGLPEDLLRSILILGRLGGPDDNSSLIRMWVTAELSLEKGRIEPLAAPIVRALCGYAAGMGITLTKTFGTSKKKTSLPWKASWNLPPAAAFCCEWAITAVARLVVESIKTTGAATTDWRTSPLAVFVQSVLVAAFELHQGADAFETKSGVKTSIKHACNTAAARLLETVQGLSSRQIELNIQQKDCQAWLNNLVAKQAQEAPRGLLPVLVRESDKAAGGVLKYY